MKNMIFCAMLVLVAVTFGFSQKKAVAKPIIFAVLDDGKTLEPIGELSGGEIVQATGGDADPKDLATFSSQYYKPGTAYDLIFGGAANGKVTVKSSNVKAECSKNTASATTVSAKAKLKGLVMALATNETAPKSGSGLRRMPTVAERGEIEALVRAEYARQKVSVAATKVLHYQNLTAVDVDNDGTPEMVGSYWVARTPKERNLLFFIAEKGSDGKYSLNYSEYKKLSPNDIMGGADIKAVDSGTYNEMLLDTFAYGNDSTAKIFTTTPGLEGSGFNVYARKDGKWTRVFEGSNYHCAF